jgi:ribosomal-protein-alanine N-acetyltransferase|tara:strand:+ start:3909 stop:4403 length:495 start_codon:yes stop_codon:yes gene_type:complete
MLQKLLVKEKLIPKTKKQKTNFKNVELSDIEKIVSIEADCHISPWSKRNFLDSKSAGNLFQVLKDDELIIGYYIACFAADECELLNITVCKHLHRQGFGKAIISYLINNCLERKTSNLFLEVRRSNKNAILLYEQKGFNEVGIRPNYYKTSNGNEDAILMALSL